MARKALLFLVVAFLIYYVVTAPEEAAEVVRAIGQTIQDAVSAILRFFDGLTP